VAEALERDPHTIGRWLAASGEGGPAPLIFEQSGWPPATRAVVGSVSDGTAGRVIVSG
jgi:hypothetical protein